MNYTFVKINTMTAAFEEVPYDLKTALKAAGWTVRASGDGLSNYNATGDLFTSMTATANGWLNVRAWYRIQSPSGNEEYTFQRISSTAVRIKVSHFAKFTGGTANATTTPSAADEMIVMGSGTDASPNGISASGMTGYRLYIGADLDPPYSWFVLPIFPGGYSSGTTSTIPFFMGQDGFSQIESTDASKIFTMSCAGNTLVASSFVTATNPGISSPGCILTARYPNASTSGGSVLGWQMANFASSSITMAGNCSGNVVTLKEELLPFGLWRPTSMVNPAFKGIANTFRLLGSNRSPGDTLSVNTTRDKIIIGQFVFPWDGSIPVV